MTQTLWILATLASHWRRHPANLVMLLVGLAIATALWSGVQALNEQARTSYDRAAAVFGGGGVRSLVSARGGLFPQELYIKLRLAGWKVSPVLEGIRASMPSRSSTTLTEPSCVLAAIPSSG
jgi:putative ABC transport system permease protein